MEKLIETIVGAIQDKKGKDIVSLDLSGLGEKVWRVEGKRTGLWVAMDYMDVVVHIFTTELRSFYKLEELWADAPLKRYDYEE